MLYIFNNPKYITKGVAENIPPRLQSLMWDLIKQLPADKDYLQVFSLSVRDGKQLVTHSQEIPEYKKEHMFDTGTALTCKVFVIDDKTHSTMLMNYEY